MHKLKSFLSAVGLFVFSACFKSETPAETPKVTSDNPSQVASNKAPAEADVSSTTMPPSTTQDKLAAPSDVAAAPADAVKTASGLASKILTPGSGTAHPEATDTVEVHYTGWTTDGKMFDSSVARGTPAKFPLNRVIKGWTEGVQLMTLGEKRRFWIPAELAYGVSPPAGAPKGMLVFDVELLNITQGAKPIAAPSDVAAPPKDAHKTKSGLAYKILEKGKGKRHPLATDKVEVHYSGWTTDGKMFDSSVQRGQTATFPLNGVIPGWTEGVQLLKEGDKARFWIPKELAYNNQPGRPMGMLVFDIELIAIH